MYSGFDYYSFGHHGGIWQGRLADSLCESDLLFNQLWQLHPDRFQSIFIHGRQVQLPRWQQAYGRDYRFSGKSSKALFLPGCLCDYLWWAQSFIDQRLNGMLVNWYDGSMGHYIGAHRDSTTGMINNSVIVMISLGESRITRFRPIKGGDYIDVEVGHGSVIILPLVTNRLFKHEIPKFKRYQGKRISITLRCFE